MKLFFYRGEAPNFGDELNPWLIPKVLPGLIDDKGPELLLAIGSVLFDHHDSDAIKIVFGSGYGGYTPVPDTSRNWRFYCVRGPRTAAALNLPPEMVAGDTAILLRDYIPKRAAPIKGPVSFIPHFQSIARGHWQRACEQAGVAFIDPRGEIADVVRQIQASRVVLTEAMHGAIVSDALRVPWVPLSPLDKTHHAKWFDWAEALYVKVDFAPLPPSSLIEADFARRGRQRRRSIASLPFAGPVLKMIDPRYVDTAENALRAAAERPPTLSRDTDLDRATTKLKEAGARLMRDYGHVAV